MTRVAIVAASASARRTVRRALESRPDVSVVAVVATASALAASAGGGGLESPAPDVVIIVGGERFAARQVRALSFAPDDEDADASRHSFGPAIDTALTAREREVLALVADGMGNKHIAARLGISRNTVKTHLESVFEKLGVSTRAEAVATGARRGVLLL